MSKLRILQIIGSLRTGGAERIVAQLASNLDRLKFEVKVISLERSSGSELEKMLIGNEIHVSYLNKQPNAQYDLRTHFSLDDVIKKYQPDVIHTHLQCLIYVLPSIIFRRLSVKIHTVHNLAEKEVNTRLRLGYRIGFVCGVVPVAVSKKVVESIKRIYGIDKIPLIPNGIPIEVYQRPNVSRKLWRSRQHFNDEDIIFVCIARLSPQKNHQLLFDAFSKTTFYCPNVHLLLIGEGELMPVLKYQANALGLSDKIHFFGSRPDISDIFGAADVFVLSSDYEGDPLSVKEAMAAGKPVISTMVGGVTESVEDGKSGVLVPKGDAEALSRAMRYLIDNPNVRAAMGKYAAEVASERFGIVGMTKAYESLYMELWKAKNRE